ncbi:beta-lactamase [Seiridium cupressi]
MESIEGVIGKAIENGTILGAVLLAKDKSGSLDYVRAFGNRQISPEVKPMSPDTVFTIASMTKLMTTIAALQLVERKIVALDDDVTPLLLVLAKQEVVTGFRQDGSPVTETRRYPITFRQLLTHSSGIGYDFLHPEINQYKEYHKLPMAGITTINGRFGTPLLHQPGEGWSYGGSLDWTGQLVEKLSGLTLEEYMKKHIWDPLGLKDITFWPDSHLKDFRARRAAMSIRDSQTGKAVQSRKPIDLGAGLVEAAGGQGAFATMTDYMEIVHSLLMDDERLLGKETTEMMFKPQLSPSSKAALLANFEHPEWAVGNYPNTREYDWGFGGILIDGDSHAYRKRSALFWSGAPNLVWFVDRVAGVCGVFGSQLLPSADPEIEILMKAFEEAVYSHSSVKTKL